MKYCAKKQMGANRCSIFETGGDPKPPAPAPDEVMEAILSDQRPIDGVNDDDHAGSDIV